MDTLINGLISGFNSSVFKAENKSVSQLSDDSSSENSIAFLENELGKNLPGFTPIEKLNTADFTPAAVADRVLNFIESTINSRAGSELEAQSLLQEAREGVAQGFSEARDILNSIAEVTGEIDNQINETENLIFSGLDNLATSLITPSQQNNTRSLISESASLSTAFEQSREASIEIVTQDGDKVEVSYSAFVQASSNQNYARNQQGEFSSSEFLNASSIEFQFSVQGDLDEGEQQAISELLTEVGSLADTFFSGDVQAAFNSALNLGFDSSELKSFALDFQQSTYVEVVQTYQRTEKINQPVESAQSPLAAIDVLSQLEALLEKSKQQGIIEAPENTVKSLLVDMLNVLNKDSDSLLTNYIKEIIESA
ncbi:hypothetical protein MNBD_GAMMA08-2271 [hydrothermal vent metagenome]|uniref:DUF5610 domain-containing protein n=1 Tax=hydrothermal vent metagenome TaxID=652676 RepID=A0A3B0X106_9ZZZZ